MKTLTKKVAIITGAGSGIGKTIAELFAMEGASVMLADIHQPNIEAVAAEITAKGGVALGFAADVSNEEHVKLLIENTIRTFGTLDILVNNAGIMDSFIPVEDVSSELWNKVLGVNLNGPFYTSKYAIKLFLHHEGGNIINIASIGGLFGGRAGAAYTASKHGVIGLTKNIGYQYASKGIRCNAIAPGGIDTNIMQGMEPHPFGFDRMNAGISNMPRTGIPSEIAELALFLASDKSSFINGSVITADGGWTAY
jgi:NAD(P)-dependent dehydrogenase (short-subunit alcohol dehydrogenase family)